MDDNRPENGQWCIVEIMGKKLLAGYVTKEEQFGATLLRVDVPETSAFPAFTQLYGNNAIYCVTPVSEEVARLTAEHSRINPISVYVPDLQDMRRVKQENDELRDTLREMSERLAKAQGLPAPARPEPDPLGYPDGNPDDDLNDEEL